MPTPEEMTLDKFLDKVLVHPADQQSRTYALIAYRLALLRAEANGAYEAAMEAKNVAFNGGTSESTAMAALLVAKAKGEAWDKAIAQAGLDLAIAKITA